MNDAVRVAVIDYGAGNISSMINSLNFIGADAQVVSDPLKLKDFTHIIIPGVGSFDSAMTNLNSTGFTQALNTQKQNGRYILGVCLGMQVLCNKSEEGVLAGLGWIDVNVESLSGIASDQKIPHVGWNSIEHIDHPIFDDLGDFLDVYFVHSFGVVNKYKDVCISQTNYGLNFASVVSNGRVIGMQFHPEKSQNVGLKLLKNFLSLDI